MKRVILGALLGSAALALAAPASADMVTFAYYGRITDGFDTTGVFGAANTDLTGDAIRAVFVFDTSLGERGTIAGTTDSVVGGTQVPGSPATPLVSATITINGHNLSIGGDLLGSALTNAGVFNASEAVGSLTDFVDAFVDTPDAPASLDTPFSPHGSGGGSFNIDSLSALGVQQTATADFAIPEPATWAILLTGFAGIGAAMRERRRRFAID